MSKLGFVAACRLGHESVAGGGGGGVIDAGEVPIAGITTVTAPYKKASMPA
jgi:hypothetical protein